MDLTCWTVSECRIFQIVTPKTWCMRYADTCRQLLFVISLVNLILWGCYWLLFVLFDKVSWKLLLVSDGSSKWPYSSYTLAHLLVRCVPVDWIFHIWNREVGSLLPLHCFWKYCDWTRSGNAVGIIWQISRCDLTKHWNTFLWWLPKQHDKLSFQAHHQMIRTNPV